MRVLVIFFVLSQAYAEDIFSNMRSERASLNDILTKDTIQSLNFDIHDLEKNSRNFKDSARFLYKGYLFFK